MSINFPNADFTPQLVGYTGQGAFRFWCQKVLPIVYDDSLSYYELLNKVVTYLNNVIADVANVETNIGELSDSYNSLQTYVNEHMQEIVGVVNQYTEFTENYFENLDVQEEINQKLDEMASDGSLSTLIGPLVAVTAPDIITQWLNDHITPTTPIVDDTLTVSGAAADAKTVGSVFSRSIIEKTFYNTQWEQGSITGGGGGETSSAIWCRLPGYLAFKGYYPGKIKVAVKEGYVVRIFHRNSNNSYTGYIEKTSGEHEVSVPLDTSYLDYTIRKEDSTNLTPEDVPSDALKLTYYGMEGQALNIAQNIIINKNSDLNNFKNPGSYYSDSSSTTATLLNCPITDTGFTLVVAQSRQYGSTYIRQFLFRNSINANEFYTRFGTSSWGAWDKVVYQTGLNEYFNISKNTSIPENADLNDYTTPGTFYSPNSERTASIVNCPLNDTSFYLLVIRPLSGNSSYIRQILLRNEKDQRIFTRFKTSLWGEWEEILTADALSSPVVIGANKVALEQRSAKNVLKTINVATFNVAHYQNSKSGIYLYSLDKMLHSWRRWVMNSDIDILFQQEDSLYIDENGTKIAYDWLYKAYFYDHRLDHAPLRGKAIYTKFPSFDNNLINEDVQNYLYPTKSSYPFCWTQDTIEGVGKVLLIDVHNFPRGSNVGTTNTSDIYALRSKYLEELADFILNLDYDPNHVREQHDYCIVAGDFNAGNYAAASYYEETPPSIQQDYDAILSFCEATGMKPVNGGEIGWFKTAGLQSAAYRAFDNILVSDNIRIEKIECNPWDRKFLYSDHVPVLAKISFLSNT